MDYTSMATALLMRLWPGGTSPPSVGSAASLPIPAMQIPAANILNLASMVMMIAMMIANDMTSPNDPSRRGGSVPMDGVTLTVVG